jgi:hypothetical protein
MVTLDPAERNEGDTSSDNAFGVTRAWGQLIAHLVLMTVRNQWRYMRGSSPDTGTGKREERVRILSEEPSTLASPPGDRQFVIPTLFLRHATCILYFIMAVWLMIPQAKERG